MSERSRLRGLLGDASDDVHKAVAHIDEALGYIESYPFLGEDNPFLVRILKIQKTELETAADLIWSQRKHLR
jgi:hypothetical protein